MGRAKQQNLLRIGKDIDSDRRSKDMQVSDNGTPPRCRCRDAAYAIYVRTGETRATLNIGGKD